MLVAATGGTARHSLVLDHALRPLFAHLKATVAPTGVYAAAEDWGSGGVGQGLAERIERAAAELARLTAATVKDGPADPFGDVVPFEQLLSG